MKCSHTNKNNLPCKASAMIGSSFRFVHNPATKDKHKEATAKGGKSSFKDSSPLAEPIDLSSSENLLKLLEDTVNRIRVIKPNGSIDIKSANSIGFLASKIIEVKRQLVLENGVLAEEEIIEFQNWKRSNDRFERMWQEDPENVKNQILAASRMLKEELDEEI